MRRGTTPTHIFTLPQGMQTSTFSDVYITYSQMGRVVTEKEKDDLTIAENEIRVTLTQEDTLQFLPGKVEIQIRVKTVSGNAFASDIVVTSAQKILKDGVI